MAFAFNPFTGNFDLKGSGGGGGSAFFAGEVATYADLPLDGTAPLNNAWLVREASGTWLIARKPAGIYIRTATGGTDRNDDWTYAGILPDVFNDANFLLYDNADSSKNLAFQLSGITTGQTRTLTVPDKNITIADDADIPDPSTATPQALGSASAGTSADYSRGDHIHAAPALNDLSNVSAATPSDNDVLVFDTATSTWVAEAPAASGIAGSTGSTTNAILRADGTGGSTLQDSALVIDDATTSTQANVAITNQHSETNSALVLTPKGTGAFIVGPKPDGTSTGGNERGTNAICAVLGRNAATQVASGNNSVAIGYRSTAGGTGSISLLGSAGGTYTVALGFGTSGAGNTVAAGSFANASGNVSVAIGSSVTTSAPLSVGLNQGASLRSQFSTRCFESVYWGGQTTNDTATVLNLDAAATNRFTIAANTALAVDILLVARRSDTADKWLVARRFLGIRRDGSNNTSLIGSVQTLGSDQSEGSPTWSFALTADDTNEALQLEVTGAASETVQWRATAFYRVV